MTDLRDKMADILSGYYGSPEPLTGAVLDRLMPVIDQALAEQRDDIASLITSLITGHFLAHNADPHCTTCRVLRDAVEWIREGKEPS